MDFLVIIYIVDTDFHCFEKKIRHVLDRGKLVGEELCQGEKDYKSGGIFYSLFLASKVK